MLTQITSAIKVFLLLTLFTGLLYPLTVTGISQFLFPVQASGSLIFDASGRPTGSLLVGQEFTGPDQFWGRLSQTPEHSYNSSASGGSNLGSSNNELRERAEQRLKALGDVPTLVPVDLVTASGSGLDPHISPTSALVQVPRIAQATGLPQASLENLVHELTESPTWGVLGQTRVNVIALNRGLQDLLNTNETKSLPRSPQ